VLGSTPAQGLHLLQVYRHLRGVAAHCSEGFIERRQNPCSLDRHREAVTVHVGPLKRGETRETGPTPRRIRSSNKIAQNLRGGIVARLRRNDRDAPLAAPPGRNENHDVRRKLVYTGVTKEKRRVVVTGAVSG
jgi:hypothetical protein